MLSSMVALLLLYTKSDNAVHTKALILLVCSGANIYTLPSISMPTITYCLPEFLMVSW